MAYSPALYFASHLDRLTEELLPSLSAKRKLKKQSKKNNISTNNIKD
jgi:hypothetical protein